VPRGWVRPYHNGRLADFPELGELILTISVVDFLARVPARGASVYGGEARGPQTLAQIPGLQGEYYQIRPS